MSASPSGVPNGQPQNPKPLRPPVKRRPRPPVDPLVARKRPLPKSNAPPSSVSNATLNRSGAVGASSKPAQSTETPSLVSQDMANLQMSRKKYGGWSEPPPSGGCADFPIVTTKRALREGLRYHIMRFHQSNLTDKPIDPTDPDQFTRPVTLQRRDPRQPPAGRAIKEDTPVPLKLEDEKEAERLAQIKAEREAQKAIDQAKIAPGSKDPAPKRPQKQTKDKPTQFSRAPRTEKQRKEADLRYEEALPWHLEDADGKNVWVGQYISQLSETNVAFVINGTTFRMIPLEKQYKMLAKPPFRPYSIEEAEVLMKGTQKSGGISRWHHRHAQRLQAEEELNQTRTLFGGKSRVRGESNTFKSASRSEKMDHDQLDVEGDEFQDDDENPGFEAEEDEDNKESMDRIRRNQLGANLFGDADEQEVDKEEEEVKREEQERKMLGKKIRKALIKNEKSLTYEDDDSNSDPFATGSSVSAIRFNEAK
jgi:transcription initiation factor TFIIF subunit alpha